jgi:hypothetical protein
LDGNMSGINNYKDDIEDYRIVDWYFIGIN